MFELIIFVPVHQMISACELAVTAKARYRWAKLMENCELLYGNKKIMLTRDT